MTQKKENEMILSRVWSSPAHRAVQSALRWLLAFWAAAALLSCQRTDPVYHTTFTALGTVVDVSLYDVEPAAAEAAVRDIESAMTGVERRWHAWHPSELTDINARLARGEHAPLDASSLAYLKRAAELSRASGDRFNPAIGSLIKVWGFASDEAPHGPPPARATIDEFLSKRVTMADLQFDANGVTSRNPALQLDLGGWAKTIALDEAVARLNARSIRNALINIGGDLRLLGDKGGAPWRVGIRHPREAGVMAAAEGRGDESVFTSGDYERFFEWEGVRYQHIIDPHTGYPAAGIASATVIHRDTAVAEAASKALLIAGVDGWRRVAAQLGVDQAMIVTTDLQVQTTRAMDQRVTFTREPVRKQNVD